MLRSLQSDKNSLILASASPRRLDLLDQLNIRPDQVVHPGIDETPETGEKPADYVRRMAIEKAARVETMLKPSVSSNYILSGDTVVAIGRRILPEADSAEAARGCLEALSGRRHQVYGGIALVLPDSSKRVRVVKSHVKFCQISPTDIERYLATGEWIGKAGGYAIQGRASGFIKHISGSYSNIVGLSIYDVNLMLCGSGWFGTAKNGT